MTAELAGAIGIASGLVGAGISYGLLRGKVASLERDVARLEASKASAEALAALQNVIERVERELRDGLQRIERAVDRWREDTSPGR